ncbi:hypothetical protein D516_2510 [Rhodobacter sp. AKP1]|nr:hypothetical protein D516_2510 [Rhodobacter sp. AKP1]
MRQSRQTAGRTAEAGSPRAIRPAASAFGIDGASSAITLTATKAGDVP